MTFGITILDDEPLVAQSLTSIVSTTGNPCVTHTHPEAALRQIDADRPQLVITDLMMPEMNGMEVLRRVKEIDPAIQVVMVTGYGSVGRAVEAMRAGAADFITKPYRIQEIRDVISSVLEAPGSNEPSLPSLSGTAVPTTGPLVVGRHAGYRAVHERARSLALTRQPVLLLGAEGTGKQTVARLIHASSAGQAGAFVAVNCAAVPEALFEPELFGPNGAWMRADGGTLFLGNFEALPARLHEMLFDRNHRPSSPEDDRGPSRIVFATTLTVREIAGSAGPGHLVFGRVGDAVLEIPTLADRACDLPDYVRSMLASLAAKYERAVPAIDHAAGDILRRYGWPGNLPELEQVLERALILAGKPLIQASHLPGRMGHPHHEHAA